MSVLQFGAIPNDGQNDAAALRKAAAYCRANKGTTLLFPRGIYDFVDAEAQEIEANALSGRWGSWPDVQGRLFTPQSPYVRALDFTGCEGLHIKARGAELRLDGWYEVITLTRTKDVVIDGLRISYRRSAVTEMTVDKVNEDGTFEMSFNPDYYTHLDKEVKGRTHVYNSKEGLIQFRSVKEMRLLAPGRVLARGGARPAVGDVYLNRNGGHYRPCILVKESEQTVLRNVHIASHCGMGVVGHHSNNIELDHCLFLPEEGHIVSTWTDATHFTSCTGTIHIHHCRFAGSGDDCTNIHNYYSCVYPQSDGRLELRLEGVDLHALSLDYPEVGDTLMALSRSNMQDYGRFVVTAVDTSTVNWQVLVRLDRPLTGFKAEDCYMTNLTRMPNVEIHHNHSTTHLGRSYLIKSNKRVRIHHNHIEGSNLSAIKLGGELWWHEAGPVNDVVIEKNHISRCGIDCADDDGCAVRTSTESPSTPPHVNRHIVIRKNKLVDMRSKYLFCLQDADCVVIEKNQYEGYSEPTVTRNCGDVTER